MKKLILLVAMLAVGIAASAQGHMVINTEKIFKSMPAYVSAVEGLDARAEQYQKALDDAYAEIEKMYTSYQSQRSGLSEAQARQLEQTISTREQQAERYQQEKFGQEGELIQQRIEIIKPIQEKVFGIISKYAADHGYTLVVDVAANANVIYYAPGVDKTEEIIKLVK